jgi:hypothetical protein
MADGTGTTAQKVMGDGSSEFKRRGCQNKSNGVGSGGKIAPKLAYSAPATCSRSTKEKLIRAGVLVLK